MTHDWKLHLPDEIRATRVVLRAPARGSEDGDADAFVEAVRESVDTVGRFMSWAHAAYSRDEALLWFSTCRDARERGDAFEYLMFDDARLVGGCGLNGVNRLHRLANLGYWIRASAERRGFTSDAARTLSRAGIAAGLERVEIVADVRNLASQRVAEKAGATREGVLRARIFLHGAPCDAVGFSIVRADCGATDGSAALDSAGASK